MIEDLSRKNVDIEASPDAYLSFLDTKLMLVMYEDAVQSLELGIAAEKRSTNEASLFDGKPYLSFSTLRKKGMAQMGWVATPMIRLKEIEDLRASIQQVGRSLVEDYVLRFNEQSIETREARKREWDTSRTIDGMPDSVAALAHKLRWSGAGALLSVVW
ncbi:MAG: hypothetical protein AB8H80_12290 [Planctomycetota bacterium]